MIPEGSSLHGPGTSFRQPPPLCPSVRGLTAALCGGGDEGGENIGKGLGLVSEN